MFNTRVLTVTLVLFCMKNEVIFKTNIMELNFLEKNCWFVGATSVDRPSAGGSFHQCRIQGRKGRL